MPIDHDWFAVLEKKNPFVKTIAVDQDNKVADLSVHNDRGIIEVKVRDLDEDLTPDYIIRSIKRANKQLEKYSVFSVRMLVIVYQGETKISQPEFTRTCLRSFSKGKRFRSVDVVNTIHVSNDRVLANVSFSKFHSTTPGKDKYTEWLSLNFADLVQLSLNGAHFQPTEFIIDPDKPLGSGIPFKNPPVFGDPAQ